MIQFKSIRWRLTIWNVCFLVLVLAVFCVLMLVQVRRHLAERADASLREEIDEIAEEMHFFPNRVDLIVQLEKRFKSHAHFHFQVYENGERLFQSRYLTNITLPVPPDPDVLRGSSFQNVDLPAIGRHRILDLAIRDAEARPLLFRAVSSMEDLENDFRSYLWITITLIPIAIAGTFLSGYFVAGRMLAPIQSINDAAGRMHLNALNGKLEVLNPDDELGILSTTLNHTFERLHVALEEMRRFTSDAAHELRSPIASLQTQSEVLLRHPRTNEEYQSGVAGTLQETRRLGRLVDQLLTLSRHDAGILDGEMEEVPVTAILRDVVENLESIACEKSIGLDLIVQTEFHAIGDDVWLSQLFYNLIENAIKFTPSGGKVQIIAGVDGTQGRIVIQDTGIGIGSEHLPHIFDRFYRVDSSREHFRGTGLGLSICKSIVESHHGTIDVESKLDEGTRFTVCIPARSSTIASSCE